MMGYAAWRLTHPTATDSAEPVREHPGGLGKTTVGVLPIGYLCPGATFESDTTVNT